MKSEWHLDVVGRLVLFIYTPDTEFGLLKRRAVQCFGEFGFE